MIGTLALILLGNFSPQEPLHLARAARVEGRFGAAWAALAEVPNELEAERERAELYYAAGEPLTALGHVEAGLRLAPGDLGLLHRSLSLSEWVGDAERMTAYLERLEAAVEGGDLGADARTQWRDEVARFGGRCAVLREDAKRRAGALSRAKGTALSLMGLGVLGLLVLSVRASRGT